MDILFPIKCALCKLGCIIFFAFTQSCYSQSFPSINFSSLTEKDGLSNNDVQCITQDKSGFIWVSTKDGLSRLDGYRIKSFFNHPDDSSSLVNNNISGIGADQKNNIWIATVDGVSCYNNLNQRFKNFRHLTSGPDNLNSDYSRGMYFDSVENRTWVCLPNTLCGFSSGLDFKALPINAPKKIKESANSNVHYWSIYEDKEHSLWSFYSNYIFKLDRKTKKITGVVETKNGDIRSFIEDRDHHYWVGTYGSGLYQFNPRDQSFTAIPIANNPKVISSICEWRDKDGHYWIVLGSGAGLILFDPQTKQSRLFSNTSQNLFSLLPGIVNCLFVDRQNILWVGTENGLSFIEPSKQLFENWDIVSGNQKSNQSQNDFSYCFFEHNHSFRWSNWSDTGLFERGPNSKTLRMNIKTPTSKYSTSNYFPNKSYGFAGLDTNRFIYSTEFGLIEYSGSDHLFKMYPVSGYKVTPPGLRTIIPFDDSLYYIRSRNNSPNGIYVYNSHQHQFVHHYSSGCAGCLPPNLLDLIVTRDKKVFVSPENHYLYQLDKKKNQFVPFFSHEDENKKMPSRSFDCLAEGPTGNLWVGTDNGLFELDIKSKKIISDFTLNKLIGGISISKICFDDDQNLWITTERGLFCLLSRTREVLHFSVNDGLPSNSLPGILQKGLNGFMYAGALRYIVRFRPMDLLYKQNQGNVKISELTVMNIPCMIPVNRDNEKEITLKPGQSIFTIDFSILNYDDGSGNHYYYKLDGIMNEWKENPNGHLIFYNLPAGKYTLHVLGADKNRRKLHEDYVLIDVQPFWWQSRWFYLVLILSVSLVSYMLVRRRIKGIRTQASLNQKNIEAEMMALRAQMNPHFIFNCMNIIDSLISDNRREEAQEFLQKYSKLIRLVLENSQHKLVLLKKDLKALELYIELEAIRSNHQFNYKIEVDNELLENDYEIPPLLLQPYVENAIIHGLRNKEQEKGSLTILIKKEDNQIEVIIEDNGIGREKALMLKRGNQKPQEQFGMKATGRRIDLLQQENPKKVDIQITDVFESGEVGTKVRIILPEIFSF